MTVEVAMARPGAVILASRQYPQGGRRQQDNTNRQNPLSLDGRGIKGEGETRQHQHCHVIADLTRNDTSHPCKFPPVVSRLRGNDG